MYVTAVTVMGDSGKQYAVRASLEGLECTCPAWRYSSDRSCKHIRFVRKTLVGE